MNCPFSTKVLYLIDKIDTTVLELTVFSPFHLQAHHTKEALAVCSEVLEKEPNNVDAIIDRAEAHIQNEMFEEGKYGCNQELHANMQCFEVQ